jgi:GNAT superfamily N-acetyltransferase
MRVEKDGYAITTDAVDVEAVHAYLTQSYWSPGIPREVVARAVKGSLCFSLFQGEAQVGFARLVTDRATFAYLADVYVLEAHRGKGLSKWLMETLMGHPELQGLRRWILMTKDAHGLYAQFGFKPLANPARAMEIVDPDVYQR